MKVIFHIDMDCFFASCHEAYDQKLHNLPIAVCYNKSKSIVLTTNYNARKYNINAGMSLFKLKKICPQIVVIEPNQNLYNETANKIFNLIYKIIKNKKNIEIASIDECYIDATNLYKPYKTAYNYAKMIQNIIYDTIHIPCSIGISFNKPFAKIASNNAKPYGIKIITEKNYQNIIYPMPVNYFSGIGKKTTLKLEELGIKTLGELRDYQNKFLLKKIFGKYIINILKDLNGEGSTDIVNNNVKSISNEFTLENNTNTFNNIENYIWKLSNHLEKRIKKKYLLCNTITLIIKYDNFIKKTYQKKINSYTNDKQFIYQIALKLLEKNWDEKNIRLIGLKLSGFKNYSQVYNQQKINFNNINENNDFSHKFNFINDINRKYHHQVIVWGKNLVYNKDNEIIENNKIKIIEN